MRDIVMDGTEGSQNTRNNKQSQNGFVRFVFEWIIKGLLVFLLLGIDFMLFAGSGSQEIFFGDSLQPEITTILLSLLSLSLILMLLVSFSSILQNLLVSLITGGFVIAFLNQFAQYDKTSILVPMLSPYLGMDIASMFMGNSHLILAIGAGLITFIVLSMSSKTNIAYFVGILLVVFSGIMVDDYIIKDKRQEYTVKYDNHLDKTNERPKKYVYLFLPNATSYIKLGELADMSGSTEKAQEIQERLIAFLAKNKFWVYPHAYVKEKDTLNNVVEAVNNMDDQNAEPHIQQNIEIDSLWNFHNLNDEYIYLKDSQLIDVYKNSKYQITAYQSRGVNLCNKNNETNVDKCVDKINTPINVSDLPLSTWEKSRFLLFQWLNSFHFTTDWSDVYSIVDGIISAERTPIIGLPYDSLYVVNSFNTLDVLFEDISKDKGSRVYFVFMDLPSDMYIYDEFCRMKNEDRWQTMENYKWVHNNNVFIKRAAYQDQMSCMIGKLEQFMQKLHDNKLDENMVIVLQGVSGINDIAKTDNYIEEFKSKNLVLLAIKNAARNSFTVNNHFCESRELVRNYLYQQGNCREFNRLGFQGTSAQGLQNDLLRSVLTQEKVNKAIQNFDEWYKNWSNINQDKKGTGLLAQPLLLPQSQETQEETGKQVPETDIVVNEVKTMENPITEETEVAVEALPQTYTTEEMPESEEIPLLQENSVDELFPSQAN